MEFIIGTILTLATAYLGLWYSNKIRVKPQLSLIDQNWMTLIDTFEENFKYIRFENYNLTSNTNLYYYEGIVINTGNADIDRSKMYGPLKITLPHSAKIIELKTNSEINNKIGLRVDKADNSFSFYWDLLKPLEYYTFEILIESSQTLNEKKIHQELIIEHRISDLNKIHRIDNWDVKSSKQKRTIISSVIGFAGMLFFLIMPSYLAFKQFKSFISPEVEVKYELYSILTKTPITLKPYSIDTLKIVDPEGISKSININDVNKAIYAVPSVEIQANNYAGAVFYTAIVLFVFYGMFQIIREEIKARRISQILRSVK